MRSLFKVAGVVLSAAAMIVTFRAVSAQQLGGPGELPRGAVHLALSDIDDLFNRSDANKDRRLNADELPEQLRERFRLIDLDHDGYVSRGELEHSVEGNARLVTNRGPVLTDNLIAVVDDFIVDVYHNGERVSDSKRTLMNEIFGATVEKIDIQVRKGDWVVFNVVNNRLRWGGARYFAVAGLKEGAGTTFTTDLTTGRWSRCDDPSQVSAFIADPKFLADQRVYGIDAPWDQGNTLMHQYADGWNGTAVWGENRNTWIKFVAR